MTNINFPCPIIGNGDNYTKDAELKFEDDIDWIIEDDGVRLKIPLPTLTDDKLQTLFTESQLSLFLEISSPSSYFHDVISVDYSHSSNYIYEIFFEKGKLNKKVNYIFYLVSNKNNLFITPNKLSLDYPPTFRAANFDILAMTKREDIHIEHEFDPYTSAQDSFMVITSNHENSNKKTNVDFTQDRIIIKLPVDTFENYQTLNSSHAEILHSSIVFPVLCQAISYLQDPEKQEEFNEFNWYGRLNQIIEENKLQTLKEPLIMAMQILKDPINRGIDYLAFKNSKDQEENDL